MSDWRNVCPCCLRELPAKARLCPEHGEPPDPAVGAVLENSYRIARLLTSGGMGRIYLGEDLRLGRRVAVKILRPGHDADPDLVHRFQREARAIAALDHQNVVTIHDVRTLEENDLCLVMEYLEGESLSGRLARAGPLPLSAAMRILSQAAKALGAAHARGLVHRDVTPDNIMLVQRDGRDDFVKILDFGLVKAKVGGFSGVYSTAEGAVLGTPAYMAPEQVRSGRVDHRADVYGLGMVAYAMVCGEPAYKGNPTAVAMAHVLRTPAPPRSRRPDLPVGAEQAILRCLEKDPEHRFVAVEEFSAMFSRAILDSSRDVQAFRDPDDGDTASALPDHVREHAVGTAATTANPVPESIRGISLDDDEDDDEPPPAADDVTVRSPIPALLRDLDLGDD